MAVDLEGEARGGRSKAVWRCGGGRMRWRGSGGIGWGWWSWWDGVNKTGRDWRLGAVGRVIVINDYINCGSWCLCLAVGGGARVSTIWGESHFLKILVHLVVFVCFERSFRSKFCAQSGHKTLCLGVVGEG